MPRGLPGTKPYVLPLINVVNEYPRFDARSIRIITQEERILGMLGPGAVRATESTEQVQAIVAYLHWLAQGTQPHQHMRGSHLVT